MPDDSGSLSTCGEWQAYQDEVAGVWWCNERSGGLRGHDSRMAAMRQLSGVLNGLAQFLGGFHMDIVINNTWQCIWPMYMDQKPFGRFVTLQVCMSGVVVVGIDAVELW